MNKNVMLASHELFEQQEHHNDFHDFVNCAVNLFTRGHIKRKAAAAKSRGAWKLQKLS